MGQQVLQLTLVSVKPVLHVVGHTGHVKRLVTPRQHFPGAVITGHYDKGVGGIEDVIDRHRASRGAHLGMGESQTALGGSPQAAVCGQAGQETSGRGTCSRFIDMCSPGPCRHQQGCQQE